MKRSASVWIKIDYHDQVLTEMNHSKKGQCQICGLMIKNHDPFFNFMYRKKVGNQSITSSICSPIRVCAKKHSTCNRFQLILYGEHCRQHRVSFDDFFYRLPHTQYNDQHQQLPHAETTRGSCRRWSDQWHKHITRARVRRNKKKPHECLKNWLVVLRKRKKPFKCTFYTLCKIQLMPLLFTPFFSYLFLQKAKEWVTIVTRTYHQQCWFKPSAKLSC